MEPVERPRTESGGPDDGSSRRATLPGGRPHPAPPARIPRREDVLIFTRFQRQGVAGPRPAPLYTISLNKLTSSRRALFFLVAPTRRRRYAAVVGLPPRPGLFGRSRPRPERRREGRGRELQHHQASGPLRLCGPVRAEPRAFLAVVPDGVGSSRGRRTARGRRFPGGTWGRPPSPRKGPSRGRESPRTPRAAGSIPGPVAPEAAPVRPTEGTG